MADGKNNLSFSSMKTEIVPGNDAIFSLSIGDLPTMDDKDGFQPLGKVDRYWIIKKLGTGGFGMVFLAKDTVA
ncbi:MAG: hypothetical protein WCS27_12920, partial [Victivallaceae bacterium]